ncbi:MAG TPA: thiamine phosphate synthase [Propionibacteriaceae bacterium]|nr:thiamine phosphate synthase [Propionibacteriaceae bacterium]
MTALMGLRARLRLARTLVVVDARQDDLPSFSRDLFAAGADIVVLRDPGASVAALRAALDGVQRVAMPLNKLVAVTGDLEAARAVMADVLVGDDDLDPGLAHGRLHEYALVGVPARSARDLPHLAESADVDFVLLGSEDVAGPEQGHELDLVRTAAHVMPVADPQGTPWFAACDPSGQRLPALVVAGARRVALTVATDADAARLEQVGRLLRRAWQDDPALEDFAFRVLSNPGPPARFRSPTEPTGW